MTRALRSFPAGSEETPHPDPQCNTTLYWLAPATLIQLTPQLHWERNSYVCLSLRQIRRGFYSA